MHSTAPSGFIFSWLPTRLGRLPLLIVLVLAVWGGEYLRRDLWEPDEARYAYVAAEMRDTGNQLVPHRNGEVYAHKPPLMFWLIQAGARFTGGSINGVAARFPSFIGGLLILWSLARLARRWYGPEVETPAVLCLAATYIFWRQVGMGQIDALLCGLEISALYLLFTAEEGPGPAPLRWAGAWIAMGLAILAKGPVGLLVPLGVYLCGSFAAGEGRRLRRAHWFWGLPLALAIPGAWLLAIVLNGAPEGYLHQLLFEQNIDRAAGGLGHRQPFYYFAAYFPLDFLPWSLFLPACLAAWKFRTETRPQDRRLVAWILFVLLFFSLSPSKRNLYTFLAYPAAVLLVAATAPTFSRVQRAWLIIPAWIWMGLLSILGLAACGAWAVPKLPFSGLILIPLGLALLASAVWLFRSRMELNSHPTRWMIRLAVIFLGFECYVGALVFPALDHLKTPDELAVAAHRQIPPDGRLILFRIDGEILALYAERRGLRVDTPDALLLAMNQQKRGIAVFQRRAWNEIKSQIPIPFTEFPFSMGNKKMVWIEFDSPGSP